MALHQTEMQHNIFYQPPWTLWTNKYFQHRTVALFLQDNLQCRILMWQIVLSLSVWESPSEIGQSRRKLVWIIWKRPIHWLTQACRDCVSVLANKPIYKCVFEFALASTLIHWTEGEWDRTVHLLYSVWDVHVWMCWKKWSHYSVHAILWQLCKFHQDSGQKNQRKIRE